MIDLDTLARAAGLPVERLRPVHDEPLGRAQHGFVPAELAYDAMEAPEHDLAVELAMSGHPLGIPAAPEVQVFADPERPARMLVVAPGAMAALEGEADLQADAREVACVLDASRAPVLLRVTLPGRDLLLAITVDHLGVVEIVPEALVTPTVDEPSLEAPPPDLEGLTLAEPLDQEVRTLAASADPLDRIAAGGLLLRLGRALGHGDPRAAARAVVSRTRAQVEAASPELLDLVDDAGAQRAWELGDDLRRLVDTPDDADAAARLVRLRDDLESVRVALELVGAARRLPGALAAADDDGEAALTTLAALAAHFPPRLVQRLGEVAWAEPHLWWARLAGRP